MKFNRFSENRGTHDNLNQEPAAAANTPTTPNFEYIDGKNEGEVFNAAGWTPSGYNDKTLTVAENWSEGLDYIFDHVAEPEMQEWFNALDGVFEGDLSSLFNTTDPANTENNLEFYFAHTPQQLIDQLEVNYTDAQIVNLLVDIGVNPAHLSGATDATDGNLTYHENRLPTWNVTQYSNEDFSNHTDVPGESILTHRQIADDQGFIFAFDRSTVDNSEVHALAVNYACGNPLDNVNSTVKIEAPDVYKLYGGVSSQGIINEHALVENTPSDKVSDVVARVFLYDRNDDNGLMFGGEDKLYLGNTTSNNLGQFDELDDLWTALFDGKSNDAYGTSLTDNELLSLIRSGELGILVDENTYQRNDGSWITSGFNNLGPIGTKADPLMDDVVLFWNNDQGFWTGFGYRAGSLNHDDEVLLAQTWQNTGINENLGVIVNGYVPPQNGGGDKPEDETPPQLEPPVEEPETPTQLEPPTE